MSVIVELDSRRRTSLGKVGRHSRYLVREEEDGTLVFQPAVVLTEFEAGLLADKPVMDQLTVAQNGETPPRKRVRRN